MVDTAVGVAVALALVAVVIFWGTGTETFREKKQEFSNSRVPITAATVDAVRYLPSWREGYESGPPNWWGVVGDPKAPYQFSHGGTWPPDMYTRLRQWSPGFDTTTNWSWDFRPGMKFKKWPRSRWVAKNDSQFYYVNNQQFF